MVTNISSCGRCIVATSFIRKVANVRKEDKMRMIKFRGREGDDNWCYGSLIQYKSREVAIANFERYGNECSTMSRTNVDPATVGQFTGLIGRNGEEIYEGDILVIEGIKYPRHYVVSWNTEKLMFCIGDTPLYALLEAGNTTMREYIVCGNIHDNPELLKVGEQ